MKMQTPAIPSPLNKNPAWFAAGFFFALLWASASSATKIGLSVAQPLVIAEVRFAMASFILLFLAHVLLRQSLPSKKVWKPLALYGLLNISIYLGLYVIAMQTVTAGIGALAVASNPAFISFLSVFFLKKGLTVTVLLSLLICTIGVLCAAWPLLGSSEMSSTGLLLLMASMVSYSAGSLYFSSRDWNGLSLMVINGWQTLLGGLFLLPAAVLFYDPASNRLNLTFWMSVSWLAGPVSIVAVQLWLWLLQTNAVRAGLWLFLCPLFGFVLAAWLVNDAISFYTVAGIGLVTCGLLLSKLNARKNEVVFD